MKLNYSARRKNGQSKIEITGNKTSRIFGLIVNNQYSDSWLIKVRTRGNTRGNRWNSEMKMKHGTRSFVWQNFGGNLNLLLQEISTRSQEAGVQFFSERLIPFNYLLFYFVFYCFCFLSCFFSFILVNCGRVFFNLFFKLPAFRNSTSIWLNKIQFKNSVVEIRMSLIKKLPNQQKNELGHL